MLNFGGNLRDCRIFFAAGRDLVEQAVLDHLKTGGSIDFISFAFLQNFLLLGGCNFLAHIYIPTNMNKCIYQVKIHKEYYYVVHSEKSSFRGEGFLFSYQIFGRLHSLIALMQ
jgi:hypothetical protein